MRSRLEYRQSTLEKLKQDYTVFRVDKDHWHGPHDKDIGPSRGILVLLGPHDGASVLPVLGRGWRGASFSFRDIWRNSDTTKGQSNEEHANRSWAGTGGHVDRAGALGTGSRECAVARRVDRASTAEGRRGRHARAVAAAVRPLAWRRYLRTAGHRMVHRGLSRREQLLREPQHPDRLPVRLVSLQQRNGPPAVPGAVADRPVVLRRRLSVVDPGTGDPRR